MSLLEQSPHFVPQSSFKHEDNRVNQQRSSCCRFYIIIIHFHYAVGLHYT